MSSLGGYQNRVLDVDLSTRSIRRYEMDASTRRRYLGGRGITSFLQFVLTGPLTDPLGADNILVFSVGPLVGTPVIAANRLTIGGKSPLTGVLGDSSAGGGWARWLKFAGYDVVLIRGKADRPVYLCVSEQGCEIADASNLWGLDVYETNDALKSRTGNDSKVAAIGPGGEKLVRFASVMFEGTHAAGRTGMGAIMGSKNLKAIVVCPGHRRRVQVASPATLERLSRDLSAILTGNQFCMSTVRRYGTIMNLEIMNELGCLGTRNRQQGRFEYIDDIKADTLRTRFLVGDRSCPSCILRCEKVVAVPDGQFATLPSKIDFFSLATLGPNCGNGNLAAIIKFNELCNRFGLDTAETGLCISFAMECYQRGLIGPNETGGLVLEWGQTDVMARLIRQIAHREGLGEILSLGLREASRRFGEATRRYAIHIKGLGCEICDPRVFKTYGSRLRTSPRGGDHLRAQGVGGLAMNDLSLAEAVSRLLWNEHACALADVLGVCKFAYNTWSANLQTARQKVGLLEQMYGAVTGEDCTPESLHEATEHLVNLERVFLVREGLRRADDDMPERFCTEPLPDGPYAGSVYDVGDAFIEEYYQQRGWDKASGVPTEDTVTRLGLEAVQNAAFERRGATPRSAG